MHITKWMSWIAVVNKIYLYNQFIYQAIFIYQSNVMYFVILTEEYMYLATLICIKKIKNSEPQTLIHLQSALL